MPNQFRDEKMIDIIKGLASRFLELESNRTSIITVTDVKIENRGKEATIYFTVFPEKAEAAVVDFVKRRRSDFKKFVMEESRLGRIPFFDFELDMGEKNRQRIDELSNKANSSTISSTSSATNLS